MRGSYKKRADGFELLCPELTMDPADQHDGGKMCADE